MAIKTSTKKRYNTSLRTYEEREKVIVFAAKHGRKKALRQYNISPSTFKRWKKEYKTEGGRLDRKYSKPCRIDTYSTQCTVIKQFLFDHKKWIQQIHGENGAYGKGQWTKAQLIRHLHVSIYPPVHLSTVYRIFNDAVKTLKNPKTEYLIPWHCDEQ